jgi:hypothetical protein
MLKKTALAFAFPLLALSGHAQGPSTPAKKELVTRILKLQQPGIEAMARTLAEQPAMDLLERAGVALSTRVAADKREAVGKEIQADAKKYVDEAVPVVQARALKLAPATIGAVLEEKFSEDELKQVAAIMESPAFAKYQQLGSDMQKALIEKLVTDTRGTIEPKVKTLELAIGKRLGIAPPPAQAAGPAAKPPAKPASK